MEIKLTTKEIKYGGIVNSNIFIIKKIDELGLNKRYLGYFMLVEILNVLINQECNMFYSFSQKLYPQVAIMFNKTPCTVERNIRNLIDKCWSKTLMIKLNMNLENGAKPKCRDFIFAVKTYLENQIF